MGDGVVGAIAAIVCKFAGFGGHEAVGYCVAQIVGEAEGDSHNKVVAASFESGRIALQKDAVVVIGMIQYSVGGVSEPGSSVSTFQKCRRYKYHTGKL